MKPRMIGIGLLLFGGVWSPGQPIAQQVGVASFEHRLETSRFDVGAGARREVAGPYERIVGDKGVFLTDTITGATLAVPNTPVAAPKDAAIAYTYPQPLTESADEHSAAVREYLTGAGVPEAEVSGMHVMATMAGGGPVSEGVQPTRSRLLWYTTQLERSLGGIPVEGSYAFAALDKGGSVITEGVYWPPISEQVVSRAQALQQRLASANDRAAFLATVQRVRPDVRDASGTVGVVHTSSGYHGEFQADALYTVVVRNPNGGKPQIVRFNDAGIPVRMPDELPSGIDSIKER
jgi:hypothetical protein